MTVGATLVDFLEHSARERPTHHAVEEQDYSICYRDLSLLTDRVCRRLRQLGVCHGDRVGIYMRKSIDSVAAILGALKAGAAYVPVDPYAPAQRNAFILCDCAVRAIVVEEKFVVNLETELAARHHSAALVVPNGAGGGRPLAVAVNDENAGSVGRDGGPSTIASDDLAYILYTSGSTGKPKGVMLTHGNATSFVDWCSEVLDVRDEDRFSSHAPFHFDLSILDIYVPLKHGATLVLVDEDAGKDPIGLASLIAKQRISVWYSTPSILSLIVQYGNLSKYNCSALRTILFAGEVFPIKYLRMLQRSLPGRRYLNLYGPTETNVCTYFEVPGEIPDERVAPYPIGKVCSHLRGKVVDERGAEVDRGIEGELCIHGAGVTQGYWNLPEQSERSYFVDSDGRRWYRTGDIVTEDENGDYIFIGRRDRMVKKRGYRVELGEIEACLYQHPSVQEAAVVASSGEEDGVTIRAILSTRDGERISLINLKPFCAQRLPPYMIPDTFEFLPALPKTSTDKIDYQKLMESGAWISH